MAELVVKLRAENERLRGALFSACDGHVDLDKLGR
jgi:hypothetical protein